jgi:hypothetical protein
VVKSYCMHSLHSPTACTHCSLTSLSPPRSHCPLHSLPPLIVCTHLSHCLHARHTRTALSHCMQSLPQKERGLSSSLLLIILVSSSWILLDLAFWVMFLIILRLILLNCLFITYLLPMHCVHCLFKALIVAAYSQLERRAIQCP